MKLISMVSNVFNAANNSRLKVLYASSSSVYGDKSPQVEGDIGNHCLHMHLQKGRMRLCRFL